MPPPALFSRLSRAPRPSDSLTPSPERHAHDFPHVSPHNIPHNITMTPAPAGTAEELPEEGSARPGRLGSGSRPAPFLYVQFAQNPAPRAFYMRQKCQICDILRHVQHSHNTAYYGVHISGIRAPPAFIAPHGVLYMTVNSRLTQIARACKKLGAWCAIFTPWGNFQPPYPCRRPSLLEAAAACP